MKIEDDMAVRNGLPRMRVDTRSTLLSWVLFSCRNLHVVGRGPRMHIVVFESVVLTQPAKAASDRAVRRCRMHAHDMLCVGKALQAPQGYISGEDF